MTWKISDAGLNDLEKKVREAAKVKPKVKERLPNILHCLSMIRKCITENEARGAVIWTSFLDDELFGSGFDKPSILKIASMIGGGRPKKIPAVMEAVDHAFINSKFKTVQGLWKYLKNQFHGEKHFTAKDSDIFFNMTDGEIENLMTIRTFSKKGKKEFMKDEQITVSAFKNYVSDCKKMDK